MRSSSFSKSCNAVVLLGLLIANLSVARGTGSTGAQNPSSKVLTRFHAQNLTILDSLLQLGQEAHVPLAIEYVDAKAVTATIAPVDLGPVTVGQVLDLLLQPQPGYSWSVREGVIAVSHQEQAVGTFNLLDQTVGEFAIPRVSLDEASSALGMTLDKELHPEIQGSGGSYVVQSFHTKVGPISMRDVTVRAALDRIINDARGEAAWMVQVPPGHLDRLPSYGLWRLVEYSSRPRGFSTLIKHVLDSYKTAG